MRAPIVGMKNDKGALEAPCREGKKNSLSTLSKALRHIKKQGVRLTMMDLIGNAAPLLYQSTHGISKISCAIPRPTPRHGARRTPPPSTSRHMSAGSGTRIRNRAAGGVGTRARPRTHYSSGAVAVLVRSRPQPLGVNDGSA